MNAPIRAALVSGWLALLFAAFGLGDQAERGRPASRQRQRHPHPARQQERRPHLPFQDSPHRPRPPATEGAAVFAQSSAKQWQIRCPECDRGMILDERCLGSSGSRCPDCQRPLEPSVGGWGARNPQAT